jgi:hypothetical protein
MAKQANKVLIEDEVFFDFCITFARLIEAKVREECAAICDNEWDGWSAESSCCAAAIRNSGGAA